MKNDDGIKRSEWLIVLISAISVFIAGIALYATLKQMRASERAYQAQAWQMLNSHMIEIDKVFIERPYIWPYFCSGKHIDSKDKNFLLVMSVADLHLDFFDSFDDPLVRELPGMDSKGEYWPIWETYFIDTFSKSPALCQRYEETKDWYGTALRGFAEKGCNEETKGNAQQKNRGDREG